MRGLSRRHRFAGLLVLISSLGTSVVGPSGYRAEDSKNDRAKQIHPQSNPEFTFKVRVNTVVVPVKATDKNGKPVRDLTAADFRMQEDGKPQAIQTFTIEDFRGSSTNGVNAASDRRPESLAVREVPPKRFIKLLIDKSHRLKVTAASKDAQLKYTSELLELDARELPVASKREEILTTALESSSPVNELPISMVVPYFYSSPDRVRAAISAKIQSRGLKFKREGGQLVCDLDVMGQAVAESGDIVARFSESYRAVRDEKNDQNPDAAVFYQRMMKLAPGAYRIKLAIADDNKQVGSAEQALIVPRMMSGKFAMSSLVVTQQATALPSLIEDIQSQLTQEDDPLIYKSYQVSVVPGSSLDRAKPMFIFYRLYNVGDQGSQYDLEAKAQITDEKGRTNVIPSIPLNSIAVPSGDRQVSIGISMPTSELLPGKYRLRVETTDHKSQQSVAGETEVQVK